MAKRKSNAVSTRRAKAGKSRAADLAPTLAERRRAIRALQKHGGAHILKPANCLIQDSPAHTVERCKRVISWLAHIEQPFHDGELAAAEADVLHTVVDALAHAEKVLLQVGSLADAEVRDV